MTSPKNSSELGIATATAVSLIIVVLAVLGVGGLLSAASGTRLDPPPSPVLPAPER